MEAARYVLNIQELENKSECFAWLQNFVWIGWKSITGQRSHQRWYVEEAAKMGAWQKEQNDIKMKINEELEDDGETLTPEQFDVRCVVVPPPTGQQKRFKRGLFNGMGSMIRFRLDKESRQK